MPVYDALYDYRDRLNHILVRHEQGALHAAQGYALLEEKRRKKAEGCKEAHMKAQMEENALAAWGTVLHMMNHSLIKLVLFVAAGVVYLGCHSLDLNEVRGFAGNDKPWLGTVFVVGAASIAGVPGRLYGVHYRYGVDYATIEHGRTVYIDNLADVWQRA